MQNRKLIIITASAAAIMFGFCFAMVPLYNVFCKATGVSTSSANGALLSQATPAQLKEQPDLSREITVQFTATNHNGMPWAFYPKVKSITVHPGESHQVLFYAKNTTPQKMTVQAIPSMTPTEAISHFHKIQCFCFNQQSLSAGESKDMPMQFRIDKAIPKDVHVITLAYTLFDVTPTPPKKAA